MRSVTPPLLHVQREKLSLEHTRFYAAETVLILEYLRSKEVVHRCGSDVIG